VALLLVLSLGPTSLYLMYNRTGGPASQKELGLQKNLRFAFMAGMDLIDLAPLTPWPWQKVCAVTNGLTEAELTQVIGFEYKDYDQLHWLPRPEYWTLIFIDPEREASWGKAHPVTPVRIPRKEVGDLMLPNGVKGTCINRGEGGLNLSRLPDTVVGTSPVVVRLVETIRHAPEGAAAPVPGAAPN
jgi:hypothetical protein